MPNPFQPLHTLRFPHDLLRLLYWVLLKPFTLADYLKRFHPQNRPETNLFTLWQRGEERPELREVVKLCLFYILFAPWPIVYGLAGLLVWFGWPVDWSIAANLALSLIATGLMGATVGGVSVAIESGLALALSFGVGMAVKSGLLFVEDHTSYSFGFAQSLVFFGVMAGALFGLMRYRERGVSFGVAIGLGSGISLGILRGDMSSIPFDVNYGVFFILFGTLVFGIISMLAGWISDWVQRASEMTGYSITLVVGIIGGILMGRLLDWPSGAAFTISYWVVYLRLYWYWLQAPWSWLQSRFSTSLRFSPVLWDELIWLRLPGLDRHLLAIIHRDRAEGLKAIMLVGQSFHQSWAAECTLLAGCRRTFGVEALAGFSVRNRHFHRLMPRLRA